MTAGATPFGLHAAIAEYGKLCALRGDHTNALMHYREALRLAVHDQTPEVVFRHYVECSLESLEHMHAYDELLEYCERAIAHYRDHPPPHELAELDLATVHQRCGVLHVKKGARSDARNALSLACEHAKRASRRLPLAETLLGWLKAELTISPDRLAAEQCRWRYFSVRVDTVHPGRAMSLPGSTGAALQAARHPGKDAQSCSTTKSRT